MARLQHNVFYEGFAALLPDFDKHTTVAALAQRAPCHEKSGVAEPDLRETP
jgi:hypothetical protein